MATTNIVDKDGKTINAADATVPSDRHFRNAWTLSGSTITEDITNGGYTSEEVDQIVENDPQLSKIVTPVDDWTYWTKWVGNFFLISGTMLTNLTIFPVNYMFTVIWLICWTFVAAKWNDRSLVVLNVFLLGTVAMTLASHIKQFFL